MTGGAEGIDYAGKSSGVLLKFRHGSSEGKFDDCVRGNDIQDAGGQAHIGCCLALKIMGKSRSQTSVRFKRVLADGAHEAFGNQRRGRRWGLIELSYNEFDADAAGEIGRHDGDGVATRFMAGTPQRRREKGEVIRVHGEQITRDDAAFRNVDLLLG